ncbi:hypothetical protein EVAR_12006_1 [Eumeta japonica]|uniref:Uncharacterized protein n=1 Tax=Eumeta variegata TaxID=151549 RepID=A0A4C1U4T1_EUMVA|nr:hypothetical protein EVAR_12006_1 [Eumeta japonica]
MAAAGLAVSPLARLNPWLSACDLEEEGAGGVRVCGDGACGSGGGAPEVLAAQNVSHLCALGAGARAHRLAELRLRACCERSPVSALDRVARADVAAGGERCQSTLYDLIELDAMAARVHCGFADVLDRYDCGQSYSVHSCQVCQTNKQASRLIVSSRSPLSHAPALGTRRAVSARGRTDDEAVIDLTERSRFLTSRRRVLRRPRRVLSYGPL